MRLTTKKESNIDRTLISHGFVEMKREPNWVRWSKLYKFKNTRFEVRVCRARKQRVFEMWVHSVGEVFLVSPFVQRNIPWYYYSIVNALHWLETNGSVFADLVRQKMLEEHHRKLFCKKKEEVRELADRFFLQKPAAGVLRHGSQKAE